MYENVYISSLISILEGMHKFYIIDIDMDSNFFYTKQLLQNQYSMTQLVQRPFRWFLLTFFFFPNQLSMNNQVGQKGVIRLDVGHLMPTKLDHNLPSSFSCIGIQEWPSYTKGGNYIWFGPSNANWILLWPRFLFSFVFGNYQKGIGLDRRGWL